MSRRLAAVLPLVVVASACSDPHAAVTDVDELPAFAAARAAGGSASGNILDVANELLEAQGSEYRIASAEYITHSGSGVSGNIIVARDVGNKRIGLDFLPDDPRRGGVDGDPNTIDFLIDQVDGATSNGLTEATTTAAITRAMNTWDARTCSNLGVNVLPLPLDLGLVQAILGFGGGLVGSDVMHAGWLPGAFFDLILPGGGASILGITFTLTFTVGDLDGDGEPDLGAREIYYNDAFPWAVDGVADVDVESVALHEAGHGLSQAHFGKIFFNPNSGKLQFSPLAVMNASYFGPQRSLGGTDEAGHCSIWSSWPIH